MILSAHPPLSRSKEAGQKIFYDFILNLSESFDIYLLTFIRKDQYQWGLEDCFNLCKEVLLIENNFFNKILSMVRRPFHPLAYNARWSNQFRSRLIQLLENNKFDFVHFEWEQMIQYLDEIPGGIYSTVTCHDVISQMYERIANNSLLSSFYNFQKKRSEIIEYKYLEKISMVITLSQKDSRILKKINTNISTQTLIPYFEKKNSKISECDKIYDLVFFGAMNRKENYDGVIWFIKNIYPKIKEEIPNISFVIVGNNPPKKLVKLSKWDKSIELTGFVDDPYKIINQSRVGIVPLKLGAGIKIKVLEFLSCGIPVVSTSIGAEGIDAIEEDGLFVEDIEQRFVDRLLELCTNYELAKNYGHRARDYICSNYALESNKYKISQIYNNPFLKQIESDNVAIVLLNWNNYSDSFECIKSLEKLEYFNYHVFLVDNNSHDNSFELLHKNYSDKLFKMEITFIKSLVNLGFAGGNNLALKKCFNEGYGYIWLLNNDTVVESGTLCNLVNEIKYDHNIGIVGSKIYYYQTNKLWFAGGKVNSLTGGTKHIGLKEIDIGQYDETREVDYISGCSLLLRRELIASIGYMSEDYFLYYEDTDWNLQAKKRGWKIKYVPRSVVYHKVSFSSGGEANLAPYVDYYYIRNAYVMVRRYRSSISGTFAAVAILWKVIKKHIKLIVRKSDRKLERSWYLFKGINHAIRFKMGKHPVFKR
ncbi:MAG TPA: glycosyltransferase [Bacilli bacterium]